jgi:hypothetical protein
MMHGLRKLSIGLIAMSAAIFVDLTPTQADLIKWVVGIFVGGNAVEYLREISNAQISKRRGQRGSGTGRIVDATVAPEITRSER